MQHRKSDKHRVNSGELFFESCKFCLKEFKTQRAYDAHNQTASHMKKMEKVNKINNSSKTENLVVLSVETINALPIVEEMKTELKKKSKNYKAIVKKYYKEKLSTLFLAVHKKTEIPAISEKSSVNISISTSAVPECQEFSCQTEQEQEKPKYIQTSCKDQDTQTDKHDDDEDDENTENKIRKIKENIRRESISQCSVSCETETNFINIPSKQSTPGEIKKEHTVEHCKTCNCKNVSAMEKMEIIDEQHRIYAIDYKLLENGHLPSELTYISSDKNNVYLHCKGMKVSVNNKTPCL